MQETSSQKLQEAAVSVQQALGRIALLVSALPPAITGISLYTMAERLYSQRRQRDRYFPPSLFGEPAWDLLLALFIAHEEGRELSVAEACKAAGVGSRAGRTWLAKLEDAGLIALGQGKGDRRQGSVGLTQDGLERLSEYLMRLL